MLPTFNVSGDILLLEHLSSRFERIKPGDVVMARSPANPRLVVCKRVLGLEGDSVTVLPTSSRGHIRQTVVWFPSFAFSLQCACLSLLMDNRFLACLSALVYHCLDRLPVVSLHNFHMFLSLGRNQRVSSWVRTYNRIVTLLHDAGTQGPCVVARR